MAETAIVTLLTNAWFLLPTVGYEQPLLHCNLFALLSVSVDFSVVENVNGPDTPCDSLSVETTLIPATDEVFMLHGITECSRHIQESKCGSFSDLSFFWSISRPFQASGTYI